MLFALLNLFVQLSASIRMHRRSTVIWMTGMSGSGKSTISNLLKKKLETVDGVGYVTLGGRRDRTIRINLFPEKMAALKITANDLVAAFNREQVVLKQIKRTIQL